MRKISMIMIAVVMAAFSAQALLIDFEAPTYTTVGGWDLLGGQDDWTTSTGWAYVRNESQFPTGGNNSVDLYDGTGQALRTFDNSEWAEDTTWSFLQKRTGTTGVGNAYLYANGYQIAAVYYNHANGFAVRDGDNNYTYAFSEFDQNDIYDITLDFDFSAQTYDIVVNNLTDATSGSLTAQPFRSPVTLTQAQTGGTSQFYWDNDGGRVYFDNVEMVPEPATLSLVAVLGGTILFIRKKLMMG